MPDALYATHLPEASKRLFGIPDFRDYALADGIAEVCARSPQASDTRCHLPAPAYTRLRLRFLGNVLAT